MTKRPGTNRCGQERLSSDGSASGASDRCERRIVASSEQDKRLRAELAEGLGFYPASLSHEDVAHYRYQIAERQAREEAGERKGHRAATSGASGITSGKNGVALISKLRDAHRWPICTSEP